MLLWVFICSIFGIRGGACTLRAHPLDPPMSSYDVKTVSFYVIYSIHTIACHHFIIPILLWKQDTCTCFLYKFYHSKVRRNRCIYIYIYIYIYTSISTYFAMIKFAQKTYIYNSTKNWNTNSVHEKYWTFNCTKW